MSSQSPANPELKRPQHPSQPSTSEAGATKTPTPEQKALAISTNVAHGLRTSLNGQADHAASLQQSYLEATGAIADEMSDFFAAAISGQILWSAAAELTQQKLERLPKPERVEFDTAQALSQFKQPSWTLRGATQNRYLPSADGSFGDAA